MDNSRIPNVTWADNKVPEVTITFWFIKILSTTVGETAADYLAVNVGLGTLITDAITAMLLAIALGFQLHFRRFVPWAYWLSVLLISVAGTQLTDALTDGAGVSLYVSTACFTVLLAIVLASWHRSEKTLSIRHVDTRRRELFYWVTILCTFALGTAAGDLATEALGLGFSWGVVVFSALIAATAAGASLGMNRVLAFWIAYILTRPFGASLGDLLSQSRAYGGVGLGTVYTSASFLAVIVALVVFVSVRRPANNESSIQS
ncbi:hypothetical protein [Caballeronia sp. J97]|uniref:COG4705 family protein n=1 Tax=Caballeronia sp. J97 TaxID=2805429 RepID=UPI002AB0BF78|nr:hypothetical protein [Caballeronia sp. J97]